MNIAGSTTSRPAAARSGPATRAKPSHAVRGRRLKSLLRACGQETRAAGCGAPGAGVEVGVSRRDGRRPLAANSLAGLLQTRLQRFQPLAQLAILLLHRVEIAAKLAHFIASRFALSNGLCRQPGRAHQPTIQVAGRNLVERAQRAADARTGVQGSSSPASKAFTACWRGSPLSSR